MPSPNGSTLTLFVNNSTVLTGCLRNASAVAKAAANIGKKIAIVPAGEQWSDGSLRVAYEDLIGAGSIISKLTGIKSTESEKAEQLFHLSKQSNFEDIYPSHFKMRTSANAVFENYL